jgi:hypothetical protein
MAATSKYIQLDPQILVEYEYTDQSNPALIDTDANGARLLILSNPYIGAQHVFTEDNPFVETGNYRTISAIPINSEKTQYASLTTNNVVNYLDADPNLDNVNTLLSQLTSIPNVPPKSPAYDTIKLHLLSGFSFEDLGEGFIFEVLIKDRAGKKHTLTSIVYLASDNYEVNNPSPFISNERLFSKYILLKIPALSWITDDYINDKANPNTISNFIAKGTGYNVQNTIEISLKYISKIIDLNGQRYFQPGKEITTAINKTDEFSGLIAVIEDASAGDYFEVYGSFNGDIYEDFIINLNNQDDTDLVVVHDIVVFEQVGTSFIQTSEQSFIQTDSYDISYKFRPIILNSHIATSYRINYTLRILNKVDNSQIIRKAQYSSFDVKKYGRRFRKLNLGTVPNVTKIYNRVPSDVQDIILNNDVTFNLDGNKVIKQTEFVLGFRETIKVSASVTGVKTTPSVNQEGDIQATALGENVRVGDVPLEITSTGSANKIYNQGEGRMTISPFDDFTKFIFYDNSLKEATGSVTPQLMDLTNTGSFYLSFIDESTGDEVRIKNYTNVKGISPAQGEVIFKISKDDSRKILKFKTNNFYISARLEIGLDKSDETMMFVGQWFKPEDKYKATSTEIIEDMKKDNANLKIALESERAAASEILKNADKVTNTLKQEKSLLENKLSDLNQDIAQITSNLNSLDSIADKDILAKEKYDRAVVSPNIKLIQDKIKNGEGAFVSEKAYEKAPGVSIKKFKFNP